MAGAVNPLVDVRNAEDIDCKDTLLTSSSRSMRARRRASEDVFFCPGTVRTSSWQVMMLFIRRALGSCRGGVALVFWPQLRRAGGRTMTFWIA